MTHFCEWLSALYANPDFRLNLLAEAHGVVAEVILISVLAAFAFKAWENRKWRPARLNVAKSICQVHATLYNSSRHVIDPDFEIDAKAHGLPPETPQADAVFWGKSQFLPYLDNTLARLKKTVEFNNVALDSSLMPLVSDFLVAAEELLSTTTFLLGAYNPKTKGHVIAFSPRENIMKMHEVFTAVTTMYPEAANAGISGPSLLSGQELCALFELAEQRNQRIQYLKKPKNA